MNDLCTECVKRDLCSSLCPEAEMYAGQDWVYEQELTIADLQYSKRPWPEGFEKSKVTKMEGKILAALLVGKTREEIAKDLGITRHSLKLHIQNIRKKRLQMP